MTRDAQGRLRPSEDRTNEETKRLAMRNFHRSMLELAAQSLERPRGEELEIATLTASLTPEQYADICREVEAFRERLFQRLSMPNGTDQRVDREVYQIGFEIFPVTATRRG